jgi:hypothetical protein
MPPFVLTDRKQHSRQKGKHEAGIYTTIAFALRIANLLIAEAGQRICSTGTGV